MTLTFQMIRFCMWRRKTLRMLEGVPHIVHHKDEMFKEYHWFWGDFGNYRFHRLDFPQFRMRCLVENDSKRPVARKTRPPIFHRCCNVQIVDPRDVKYILKDNFENFVKPPDMIENFQDALGSGIFVTNHGKHAEDGGKRWYKQRKSSAKIFTRSNFKTFFLEQFASGSESLCEVLKKYSESKETLDIQRLMGNFTLDSIGHVAFGSDLGCLRREATTVEGKQPSASHRFAIAFDVAQHRAIERFVTPARKFFPASIRPYLFIGEAEVKESRKTMEAFCNKMIDEALTCQAQNKAKWENRHDLLAMHIKDKDAKHTREDLVDMILSFFIAGRDTTRATLTFFFKILTQNPEIERKLMSEMRTVFGDFKIDSKSLTFDKLQRKTMPYLDGVIQEVLRLYPPVYSDPKFCVKDDILPSGITLPASTVVSYNPYAMGRMENFLYENPLKVIPERWKKSPNDYNFPVFQGGPRVCLGKRMAYLEVKTLVVIVLSNGFRFRLDENQDLECYNLQPTLVLEHGLKAKVSRVSS